MKKFICLILLMFLALGCFGRNKNEGKILNIYTWNTEFENRFNLYYANKLPSNVKVNFIVINSTDYQTELDYALSIQRKVPADYKVDLFLVEPFYAPKYTNSIYTLDIINDLGITNEQLSQQFDYTKSLMKDAKGNLKGVTWIIEPGVFIYRRSYAKEVLGTDNPDDVQNMISTWDDFNKVAAKMNDFGYHMISGCDDTFLAFENNRTTPWIINNKLNIDPQIYKWIEQSENFTNLSYNNKANLWTDKSFRGMMEDGKVFGYLGPDWFINFVLPRDNGSAYGDWAVCKAPQSFNWGSSMLCVADDSDNLSLAKDIILTLTCDADVMYKISVECGDLVNNIPAMEKLANSDIQDDFLGGQNPMKYYLEAAKAINIIPTPDIYDYQISQMLLDNMMPYFYGNINSETAWNNFYTQVYDSFNLKSQFIKIPFVY